jgi:hypothetical protein
MLAVGKGCEEEEVKSHAKKFSIANITGRSECLFKRKWTGRDASKHVVQRGHFATIFGTRGEDDPGVPGAYE